MSDQQRGYVSRFIQSMTTSTPDYEEREPLPDRDARADWDADDSGVHSATMLYEGDHIRKFEYQFEDVNLDIMCSPDKGISIIAEERADDWRTTVLRLDADTADDVADQLELAAELIRDGITGDVRT